MISIISFDKLSLIEELILPLANLQQKEWYELNAPYQSPPINYFEKTIRLPDIPSERQVYFLAKKKDTFVGFAVIWENVGSNEHVVSIDLYIEPKVRKQGISKILINSVLKNFTPKVKNIHFVMRTDPPAPCYEERKTLEQFQIEKQAKPVYIVRRSASDIKDYNKGEIINKAIYWEKSSNQKGYSLIEVEDGKFQEQKSFKIEDFILLVQRIRNDMPKEGRQLEEIKLSVEEYMQRFDKIKTLGDRSLTYVAVEDSSGLPIAFTETWFFASQPELASQGDTGVLHEYRGKKLGLTLKYKMISYILSNPRNNSIKHWGTHNAVSNIHMIRINDELNYKENAIWKVYEYSKDQLQKIVE
ncbi:MAG: GNAT family N-acetyltransferase [Candidatus Hodarchaeales archaeon]